MDDEPQGQMFPILHWNGDSGFNERFANEFMGKTLHSDMTFYVELDDALIPGHALIVSAASPMLDQFLSDHVDLASRIIKVANCPLKDFNVMLRYIYSGIVPNLTIETAAVLLPVGLYLDLQEFNNVCENCILGSLSRENVCQTFDRIHKIVNPLLVDKCIDLIRLHVRELLADERLMQMHDEALEQILDDDWLIVSELLVFMSMLRWADQQCAAENLQVTASHRRAFLNDRLTFVRFWATNYNVFIRCVSIVGPGFFSDEEISSITMQIAMGPDYTPNPMPTTHFRSKKRVLRLTVNRIPETLLHPNSYAGVETILSRKSEATAKWFVVGFETEVNIVEIFDEFKTKKLDFTKTGNRVVLTSPQVNVFTFRFTYSMPSDEMRVYKTLSLNGHNYFYMPDQCLTIVSEFFVQRS